MKAYPDLPRLSLETHQPHLDTTLDAIGRMNPEPEFSNTGVYNWQNACSLLITIDSSISYSNVLSMGFQTVFRR
ncbi:hypothetical protein M419DRAFT_118129 [Trichoderma reesei RUT C-30]|uniref:Uncharacterized protein n=1 Tax=Hypocrea jecorina (strain ATCC 56765 / BCRC 32924 / NRRL 11460 / Rut C-30) TaxID=1344414 RepID=A0A024SFK5_HYPJR|nr:hypothetical protein M419DRAFT_118129 [Trichoderma reesei RUT C-30]